MLFGIIKFPRKKRWHRYYREFIGGKPRVVIQYQPFSLFFWWWRRHSLRTNHVQRLKLAFIQTIEWLQHVLVEIEQAEKENVRIEHELRGVNHGDRFRLVYEPREEDEPSFDEEFKKASHIFMKGGMSGYSSGMVTQYTLGPLSHLLDKKVVEATGAMRPYQPPKQQQGNRRQRNRGKGKSQGGFNITPVTDGEEEDN